MKDDDKIFIGVLIGMIIGCVLATFIIEVNADCHMLPVLNEVCQKITGNPNATIQDTFEQGEFVCDLNIQKQIIQVQESRIIILE